MKELKGIELADLLQERAALKAELDSRQIADVFLMNDIPTTPEAEKMARKTLILLARGNENEYLILSTATRGADKVVVWLHDGSELANQQEHGAGFIVIDKSRVGRPARKLTDTERQEIRQRHEAGESVNTIAKALHVGTRRVMAALKDF